MFLGRMFPLVGVFLRLSSCQLSLPREASSCSFMSNPDAAFTPSKISFTPYPGILRSSIKSRASADPRKANTFVYCFEDVHSHTPAYLLSLHSPTLSVTMLHSWSLADI